MGEERTEMRRALVCIVGVIVCVGLLVSPVASMQGGPVTQSIVVKPSDMQGWATTRFPGSGGYVAVEGRLANVWDAPPSPLSTGAFLMVTGYGDVTVGRVYLGTDAYKDIRLDRITKLEYYSLTFQDGWEPATGHWVKQPIALDLYMLKQDGLNTRYLMYRPWGQSGANSPSNYGVWQKHDCMNDAVWLDPWQGYAVRTWQEVLAAYPNATLRATPGLDGNDWVRGSPTLCSLNFRGGVPRGEDGVMGAWWQESCYLRGYVDYFTIGVQDDLGNITETTYDFQAEQNLPTYALTAKVAAAPVMTTARQLAQYATCGQITQLTTPDGTDDFFIADGSGSVVRVHAPGNDSTLYTFGRAMGTLNPTTNPPTLNCNAADVTPFYSGF